MGNITFRAEHQIAWIIAGCCAILSACITSYQVYNHIKYNTHLQLRRFIIRIILMVPIYALESWLGLRFADIALYFDLLRECYEAFVIYSFYQLLVTYLGGEVELVAMFARKETHPHVFPFCWLPGWRMTDRFHIHLTEEERARMQAAMEAQQLQRNMSHTSRALASGRPVPSTSLTTAAIVERKEDNTDEEQPASPSTTSASDSASLNPSPDFSGAASSADLSRDPGAEVERPVFRGVASATSPPLPRIPSSYLSPYSRPHHSDFLTHTQLGTLQYCIVKPLTALLAFVLSQLDLYGDSSFDWSRGYPYLAFLTNMSQIWAMYCLVLFYMCCKEELQGLKPIPKFLCVKAVVFLTFWQSVLLAILASFDVLHGTEHYSKEEVVAALQDFIVCIEMLVAAFAHHYAFSWKQFHDPVLHASAIHAQQRGRMLPALFEALNVTDVYYSDVKRVTSRSMKKKRQPHETKALTRDEMHELQMKTLYEQGIAGAGGATGAHQQALLSSDLHEPLNPDSSDSDSVVDRSIPIPPHASPAEDSESYEVTQTRRVAVSVHIQKPISEQETATL